MSEPSPEIIKQLKEKHSDRSLHQLEKFDADDSDVKYTFLVTGPTRDELDMMDQELLKCESVADKHDYKVKIRNVAEKAAYAQIRWPEREEVKRIFGLHPEMSFSFVKDLRKFAGDSFETRSKKL